LYEHLSLPLPSNAPSAIRLIFTFLKVKGARSILLGAKATGAVFKVHIVPKEWETLLKEKRQLEDDKRKQAAKSMKVLADSSLKLADFLHKWPTIIIHWNYY